MVKVLGDTRKHLRLVAGMAKATDTDLVGAFEQGRLESEEWAEIVQTCRHCKWAGRCEEWLHDHSHVTCAPGTCLNRTRFTRLKALEPVS